MALSAEYQPLEAGGLDFAKAYRQLQDAILSSAGVPEEVVTGQRRRGTLPWWLRQPVRPNDPFFRTFVNKEFRGPTVGWFPHALPVPAQYLIQAAQKTQDWLNGIFELSVDPEHARPWLRLFGNWKLEKLAAAIAICLEGSGDSTLMVPQSPTDNNLTELRRHILRGDFSGWPRNPLIMSPMSHLFTLLARAVHNAGSYAARQPVLMGTLRDCLVGLTPPDRFLPPRTIPWRTTDIVEMAVALYENSRLTATEAEKEVHRAALDQQRLLVLGDACEEAGCDNEDLLRCLRGEERVDENTFAPRDPDRDLYQGFWPLDYILQLPWSGV